MKAVVLVPPINLIMYAPRKENRRAIVKMESNPISRTKTLGASK